MPCASLGLLIHWSLALILFIGLFYYNWDILTPSKKEQVLDNLEEWQSHKCSKCTWPTEVLKSDYHSSHIYFTTECTFCSNQENRVIHLDKPIKGGESYGY